MQEEKELRGGVGRGGPGYPLKTALGQRMFDLGLRKYEVSGGAMIADRKLTEILAGRVNVTMAEAERLAEFLDCEVADLAD